MNGVSLGRQDITNSISKLFVMGGFYKMYSRFHI
jgi:hypothetical protein